MAATATHPDVHGGHGGWVSPNFHKENITRGVGDWATSTRTTGLPATKIAREGLRAFRKVALGVAEAAASSFLYPDIEHDNEGTAPLHWSGSRNIGYGSFGVAILYTGHDPVTAHQVDTIVIKEGDYRDELDVLGRHGLAREAAILADYNKQDPQNRINFLRRFAFNPKVSKQRWYLEYCEHGDLHRMKTRYALFRQFLPELYIWHVFQQLLEGLLVLEQPPHETTVMMNDCKQNLDEEAEIDRRTVSCLHLDLKLENILSCGQTTRREFGPGQAVEYPDVQIADFGIAEYIFPEHNVNPIGLRECGTEAFHPPERTHWRAYGRRRYEPPPNHPDRPFDHKHEVWVVGLICFYLMTMASQDDLPMFMAGDPETQADYHALGDHFLAHFDWRPFFEISFATNVYDSFPHSPYLRSLIREALVPDADKRPSATELLQRLGPARNAYVKRLQQGLAQQAAAGVGAPVPPSSPEQADFNQLPRPSTWEAATRLYFRGNEIDDMPDGEATFPEHWAEDDDYHLSWGDPDWPALRMPMFPDAERPVRPIIPDELVAETVRRLWQDRRFVDWPQGSKLYDFARATFDIADENVAQPPQVQRTEPEYANMGQFDILKAISDHDGVTKDEVDSMMNNSTDRRGLLRRLRELDSNPQPSEPVPRRESYDRHYASTLKGEVAKRISKEAAKNVKRRSEAIDRLVQLDANGETGDGEWRKKGRLPTVQRERKRKRQAGDVGRKQDGGGALAQPTAPTAPMGAAAPTAPGVVGAASGTTAPAATAPIATAQDNRSIAERIAARRAAGGRR